MIRYCRFFIFFTLIATPIFGENQILKIGMELSYPPFEMIDQEGKPAGISVDIAYSLAKYLKKLPKIDNIPFIGLIPSLKTGKIDLIISSLTVTEARKAVIDFSEPYLATGLCLLVSKKKSSMTGINEANKKGTVIVVKSGTTGETYARNNLSLAEIIILDKEAACVLEVVQGKADAFIYDQFSVYLNWKKNLTTTYALLDPFQIEYWAIGIQKGKKEMVDQVNAFLDQFRKEGSFEELGDRYLAEQKAAFKELGVPFVF